MAMSSLISTLLMGIILLGIIVLIGRYRNWRHAPDRILEPDQGFRNLLHSPTTWMVLFVLTAFFLTAGAIAFASEASLPGIEGQLGVLVVAILGLIIGIYIVLGTYFSAKARGFKTAQAVGISSGILGVLFLAAITIRLLVV